MSAEHVVEQHIKIIDNATGPLNALAKNAEKATHAVNNAVKSVQQAHGHATKAAHGAAHGAHEAHGAFDQLSHVLSGLGGVGLIVGAGLSLHSAIESTEQYMGNIKQIHELTGATAEETDFLLSTARRAGVPYDSMQKTMFQLSKAAAKLQIGMDATGKDTMSAGAKFKSLGVDISQGPIKSIEKMSDAAKKGKIDAGDLMTQFKIPLKDSNDMLKFLKHMSPAEMKAAKESGKFVSMDDLEAFDSLEEAHHRINDTWNRIKVTVLNKLFPVAAKMAEGLADKLESALPKIQAVMAYVQDHMGQLIFMAKTFMGIMAGKSALGWLGKLNGGKGIPTSGAAIATQAKDFIEGIAGASPLMAKFGKTIGEGASSAMLLGAGKMDALLKKTGAAKFLGAAGKEVGGVGPLLSKLNPQILSAVSGFAAGAAIIAVLAGVVLIIALAVRGFTNNIGGAQDALLEIWDSFKAKFDIIADAIANLMGVSGGATGILDTLTNIVTATFNAVFEVINTAVGGWMLLGYIIGEISGMFSQFINDVKQGFIYNFFDPILKMVSALGDAVVEILKGNFSGAKTLGVDAVKSMSQIKLPTTILNQSMVDSIGDGMGRAVSKYQKDLNAATARNKAERTKEEHKGHHGEDSREEKPNMDFRGSRFDITQNFAEGFDPDRIATAFSNDLASIGEMRSSSSYAPINAVR